MIKRSHIRQFLAVVDAGSFTQAAQRIRLTQPALSSGVAELEKMVGSALFVRDRRHVRLTEAGGHFLSIARDLERGFQAADHFGGQTTSHWPALKLGLLKTVAGDLSQRIMRAILPAMTVELIEGTDRDVRLALREGRVDAALTLLRPDEEGADHIPLYSEPYVMLVASTHPLSEASEVSPEELAPETMIARRSCELLNETSRFFLRHRVRPRFALRSENDDRCIRMVAAGLGITTAPLSLATDDTSVLRVRGYDFQRRIGLLVDRRWREARGEAAVKEVANHVVAAVNGWRSDHGRFI